MTRKEAIEWFLNSPFYHKGHVPFEMAIEALKAEPVKHGHWVEVPDEVFASTYYCSECKGKAIPDIYGKYLLSDWCYYCGAKMDGVE